MPIQIAEKSTAALDTLRGSACFAMSRGGRELFHTNFLSFVLGIEADTLDEPTKSHVAHVQTKLLKLLYGEQPPTSVVTWREKYSLDLIIMEEPDRDSDPPRFHRNALLRREKKHKSAPLPDVGLVALVIEAKLKALPDARQLIGYNKKLARHIDLPFSDAGDEPSRWAITKLSVSESSKTNTSQFWAYATSPAGGGDRPDQNAARLSCIGGASGHVRKVLLAPTMAAEALERINEDTGWEHVSLTDVATALNIEPPPGDKSLVSQLFRDYGSSTLSLLEILEETQSAVTTFVKEAPPEAQSTLGQLFEATRHRHLTNQRIHDVVGKYAYDVLARSLKNLIATTEVKGSGLAFRLESYAFFSKSQPGLGLEFVTDRESGNWVSAGVQIQGAQYRHYVSASHPNRMKTAQLATLAERAEGWLSMSSIPSDSEPSPFGEEAFLYKGVSAAKYTHAELVRRVENSMAALTDVLRSDSFINAAKAILEERKPTPRRRNRRGRVED